MNQGTTTERRQVRVPVTPSQYVAYVSLQSTIIMKIYPCPRFFVWQWIGPFAPRCWLLAAGFCPRDRILGSARIPHPRLVPSSLIDWRICPCVLFRQSVVEICLLILEDKITFDGLPWKPHIGCECWCDGRTEITGWSMEVLVTETVGVMWLGLSIALFIKDV